HIQSSELNGTLRPVAAAANSAGPQMAGLLGARQFSFPIPFNSELWMWTRTATFLLAARYRPGAAFGVFAPATRRTVALLLVLIRSSQSTLAAIWPAAG